MNKTMAKDRFFHTWYKLPHCRANQRLAHEVARARLNRELIEDASIIATNCIGGEISNALNLRFNSPFINITMARKAFVEMCSQLETYMKSELQLSYAKDGSVLGTISPSGTCNPVTIRFIHDNDIKKVDSDFQRRKERINYDKLVLITDDKGLDDEHYQMFEEIPSFRKICLCSTDRSDRYPSCYLMKQYAGKPHTGTYQGKSLNGLHKFETMWDYVAFLNGD